MNKAVLESTSNILAKLTVHVYKGKTTIGTPNIIHPGEKFGIQKGFCTITIVNPSTLIEGKFTVMVSSQ